MKFIFLLFVFVFNCLCIKSQNLLNSPPSKKWIKTEFYFFDPSKDTLSDENYDSDYSRNTYRSFKGVHGWKGEYVEITSDSTVQLYVLGKKTGRFLQETFVRDKYLLFNVKDTIEILLISEKCIVTYDRKFLYNIYSVYKKRKKVDFCECDIADLIRRFKKNE